MLWKAKAYLEAGLRLAAASKEYEGDPAFYMPVNFLLLHSAELTLKAMLFGVGEKPPRTHVLPRLLKLVDRHSLTVDDRFRFYVSHNQDEEQSMIMRYGPNASQQVSWVNYLFSIGALQAQINTLETPPPYKVLSPSPICG